METTFSRRLSISFFMMGLLTIAVAIVGIIALSHVVAAKDDVIENNENMVHMAQELQALTYRRSTAMRGYLMTGMDSYLQVANVSGNRSDELEKLLQSSANTQEGRNLAAQAAQVDAEWKKNLVEMIGMRQRNAPMPEIVQYMVTQAQPKRAELESLVDRIADVETKTVNEAKHKASAQARVYQNVFIVSVGLVLITALVLPWWLNRRLTGQIAYAVSDMQSSSAELQTTAAQQATGAREQATAMSEITTTMTELLTTSRQIAQSAQRVAGFSVETSNAAHSGDRMAQQAKLSVASVRDQVDTIVNHMLELGRRSQQIGGVTELINELAEQTNILAINANIEAVGAGEAGRRFGVVAEEIRNLADRMSGSSREVRGMVEEVRSAVNATVMATEAGSKAVDAGAKEFEVVAGAFDHINALAQTASEAAREIELSTKQQSTAVEQVNVAVSSVAQVSREVEASTIQASQTAAELAQLSSRLTALVTSKSA